MPEAYEVILDSVITLANAVKAQNHSVTLLTAMYTDLKAKLDSIEATLKEKYILEDD